MSGKSFRYSLSKKRVFIELGLVSVLFLMVSSVGLDMVRRRGAVLSGHFSDDSLLWLLLALAPWIFVLVFLVWKTGQKLSRGGLVLAGDPEGLTFRYQGKTFRKVDWQEVTGLTYEWRRRRKGVKKVYLSIALTKDRTFKVGLEGMEDRINDMVRDIRSYRPDLTLQVRESKLFE